jgi:cobalamin-dependent methionine synthase I
MKVVGELFGSRRDAAAVRAAVAETMKPRSPTSSRTWRRPTPAGKGTIVLATVKGDVHDIGKNLVDIILTNNGYTVHNLGIKQPISEIIDKAELEVNADAIGMSGLLVKSTLIMRENLEELNESAASPNIPVLLGGAALTRTYVERDLREVYEGTSVRRSSGSGASSPAAARAARRTTSSWRPRAARGCACGSTACTPRTCSRRPWSTATSRATPRATTS